MSTRYLSVTEFLEHIGHVIGRTALYALLDQRAIPSVRLGKKYIIPADALERMETGGRGINHDAK